MYHIEGRRTRSKGIFAGARGPFTTLILDRFPIANGSGMRVTLFKFQAMIRYRSTNEGGWVSDLRHFRRSSVILRPQQLEKIVVNQSEQNMHLSLRVRLKLSSTAPCTSCRDSAARCRCGPPIIRVPLISYLCVVLLKELHAPF